MIILCEPLVRLFVCFCFRSASRASVGSKGVDLRIEELKSQNRQLLEELFTLKKASEGKDEELTELKEKVRTIVCPFVLPSHSIS